MKYFIFSPTDSITGGAENLHQIGHAINQAGENAFISYYPKSHGGRAKDFFKAYGLESKLPKDNIDEILIIPELDTNIASQFNKAKRIISWLSVDNYYQKKRNKPFYDEYISIKRLLRGYRLPFFILKKFYHITQSHYASSFLEKKGINSSFVGDYINQDFIRNIETAKQQQKEKVVLYNPKKGHKYNEFVINANPQITFLPLINYTRGEMIRLLQTSKVYMDLGHHPGKDRIPREAAISGCCIITSKSGSAKNRVDVPIDEKYKVHLKKRSLLKIGKTINSIFADYEKSYRSFNEYSQIIKSEKINFSENVKNMLELYA
ncbi:MAG: hypothetical protein HQ521_00740 [Bacteroidetes bacterium]|nr:hypothetical protein [Bacteroidota bacterium]